MLREKSLHDNEVATPARQVAWRTGRIELGADPKGGEPRRAEYQGEKE